MLTVGSLFSGVGGFDLGLERAGMRVIWQAETDPYASAVLRKHWPGVPNHGDVRSIRAGNVERSDVICGGFPCQPFSHAGRRAGAEDDRHLWPEMCRIVGELRPAWVIGENVAGIISMELDTVLSDLEALGYTTRAFVIPAVAVDAPHRRDRVWIIARDADRDSEPTGTVDDEVAELRGAVADADGTRSQGRSECAHGRGERSSGQGIPESVWNAPPDAGLCGMDDGLPHRAHRLRTLGNSIVPQVAEVIGRAVMEQA